MGKALGPFIRGWLFQELVLAQDRCEPDRTGPPPIASTSQPFGEAARGVRRSSSVPQEHGTPAHGGHTPKPFSCLPRFTPVSLFTLCSSLPKGAWKGLTAG